MAEREKNYRLDSIASLTAEEEHCQVVMSKLMERMVKNNIKGKAEAALRYIPLYTLIHPYTPLYTLIHPHTPLYTLIRPYTPLYTLTHHAQELVCLSREGLCEGK